MLQRKSAAAEGSAKAQVKEYKETLVIDAAAALFYERGFDGTTLDDIAAALGVTKPFIYTYFDSKYSLLERLYDRVFDAFDRDLDEFKKLPEQDPVRRFEYFVGTYIRYNLERREFTKLLLQEEKNLSPEKMKNIRRRQHDFDRLLGTLIADGVRAGVFHVEDPALASFCLSGLVRWTYRWYNPEGRLTADEICRELTMFALRIVGYAPALAPSGAAASPPRSKRRMAK